MSVKNFWTIFLKVLGIWLVINGLTTISQFIASFSAFASGYSGNLWSVLYVGSLLILTLAVYFLILWLFVFQTAWLIDKLRLEQGFAKEEIDYNIQTSSLMTVAIIVIGGLIFVDSLPLLCQHTFNYFQQKRMFEEDFSSGWIFFYLVKTTLAYLLMTNSKSVVGFIEKQKKVNAGETAE